MGTVIFEYDVSRGLESKHKSRIFKKLSGCEVKLEIDAKVAAALEKSEDRDLATAKIVEKAQKLCQATTTELASALSALDQQLDGKSGKEALGPIKVYRAEVVKKLDGLKSKLKVLPEEQWKKFLAKYVAAKAEYKSYKVNSAVAVTLGSLGAIGSAAAVAAAVPTGGASLALGIVGLVRSVAKIAQTVHSIAVDVEKFSNALKTDIETMVADFQNAKAKSTAKDLAKSVLNTVVGAGFFTTVSTAGKKAGVLGGKVAGAYVGGVKLSRKVTESLKKTEELEKEFDKLKGKDLKKAKADLQKLEASFSKLFESAANLNAKAERVRMQLKAIRSALKVLEKDTTVLANVEKAIEILAQVGLAAGGAGVGFATASDDALKLAKTSVVLASNLMVTTKNALQ